MESCHQCVLLLVVVAAATAMGPSPHRTLSYEEAVAQAVDFYNQAQGTDHAFRLLKADPQPEWDMTSNPRQALKFTIKETVCPASQTPHGTECDFSDNGVVRDCSGFFSTEQMSPVVIISCNTVTQQPAHIRRSRSPRRSSAWWSRRRPRIGSYTLITHNGKKNKGSGGRMIMV